MIYLFVVILLAVVSQVMLKKEALLNNKLGNKSYLLNMIVSPKVMFAYLISSVSIILWVIALSKVQLLLATIVSSFSYVIIPLMDRIFFNTKITFEKKIGVILIFLGVILFLL